MKKEIICWSVILTVLVCLFFNSPILSQDTLKNKYNNEIGINTNIILGSVLSSQTPFAFTYKRLKMNKALRIYFDVYYYRKNLDNEKTLNDTLILRPGYKKNVSLNSTLGAGYEWWSDIKRWQFFYGVDIRLNFSYDLYDNRSTGYSYNRGYYSYTNVDKTKRYGTAIRPFLGIKFQINERLFISSESSLYISYSYSIKNNNWELYEYNNGVSSWQTSTYDEKGGNYNIRIYPASGIIFHYRF